MESCLRGHGAQPDRRCPTYMTVMTRVKRDLLKYFTTMGFRVELLRFPSCKSVGTIVGDTRERPHG